MNKCGIISDKPEAKELTMLLKSSMDSSKSKNDEPYQYMMDTIIRFFMNLNITHIGVMSVCFIEKLAEDVNGSNSD